MNTHSLPHLLAYLSVHKPGLVHKRAYSAENMRSFFTQGLRRISNPLPCRSRPELWFLGGLGDSVTVGFDDAGLCLAIASPDAPNGIAWEFYSIRGRSRVFWSGF